MGSVASPRVGEAVINAVAPAVERTVTEGECNLLHLLNATPPLTYKENPLKCLRVVPSLMRLNGPLRVGL